MRHYPRKKPIPTPLQLQLQAIVIALIVGHASAGIVGFAVSLVIAEHPDAQWWSLLVYFISVAGGIAVCTKKDGTLMATVLTWLPMVAAWTVFFLDTRASLPNAFFLLAGTIAFLVFVIDVMRNE